MPGSCGLSSFIFHFPIKSFQPEVDVDEEKDLIGHFFEVKVEEEDNPHEANGGHDSDLTDCISLLKEKEIKLK